jgi:predicted metal-dependent peptidase
MADNSIIEKVIIRLIRTNGVFYASLLQQMHRIPLEGEQAKQLNTCGVTIKNGRILLYWNPKFFETLTLDEARAVLEHEVQHIVRSHVERFKEKDQHIGNLATDLAQNQFITGLPKDCVTLDKFPPEWKLKEKESAEYYYDQFMKHANKISVTQHSDCGNGKGKGNEKAGSGAEKCHDGCKKGNCGKGGSYHVEIKDPKGKTIGEFDVNDMDGSEWKNADTSELAKEVIRQAVKEAKEQMERSQGTLPAGLEIAVNEILQPPKIAWNQLLRQYVAASIKSGHKNSWKKPNRRFGGTQKGRLSDHTIALSVAMDTSGSMGPEDYKIFFSELKAIQECYKADINVLECDADVHRHFKLNKYKRHDGKPKGGGGTDFCPVFDYIKEKKLRTDVLIFFTDGWGTFPKRKYSFKTIWVSTSDFDKFPFGRCIKIKDYPTRGK